MDVNGINYHSFENQPLRGVDMLSSEKMPAVEDDSDTLYINYAAVAWLEMRRAWRGDQSVTSQRKPIEPTMRKTSYEDLLSSKKRFDGPVPLGKMVGFLVRVWEGSWLEQTTWLFLIYGLALLFVRRCKNYRKDESYLGRRYQ